MMEFQIPSLDDIRIAVKEVVEDALLEFEKKNDRPMTTTEAAEYVQRTPRTLYRWISERRLPYKRVGRSYRFTRDDLDKCIGGE